jgi:hypothetical protein
MMVCLSRRREERKGKKKNKIKIREHYFIFYGLEDAFFIKVVIYVYMAKKEREQDLIDD